MRVCVRDVAGVQHVRAATSTRSPVDRKRHPSMSHWRVIPAMGIGARAKDCVLKSNQKSTTVRERWGENGSMYQNSFLSLHWRGRAI